MVKRKKKQKYLIIIIFISISILIIIAMMYFFPKLFIIHTQKLNGADISKLDTDLINSINDESVIPFTKQSVIIDSSNIKYKVIILSKNNQQLINSEKLNISSRFDKQNIITGEYSISEIVNISNNVQLIKMYSDRILKTSLGQSVNIIRAEPTGTSTKYNGVSYVNIGSANTNTFGKGVKVCVLDTGIDDNHPYIGKLPDSNKMDFSGSTNTLDYSSHGTHVAGIIMSSVKRAKKGLYTDSFEDGIAPDTTLYVGKVCDDNGNCPESNLLKGIDWCINVMHADIISMSLGGGDFSGNCDSDINCNYINSFSDSQVIFVAASGNDGAAGTSSPACCSNVVSVGSINKDGKTISGFSSVGKVDILAVGDNVDSTIPTYKNNNNGYTYYAIYSGTSMATPMISGSLSLLKSIAPSASKAQLLNALYSSAIKVNAPINKQGNGIADVYDACIKLLSIEQCKPLFKSDYNSPICGNNLIEGNEQCDGSVSTKTCVDVNKPKGKLLCNSDCTLNYSLCGTDSCIQDSDCNSIGYSCTYDYINKNYVSITQQNSGYCNNNGKCEIINSVPISNNICNKNQVCSKKGGCEIINNVCGNGIKENFEQCDGTDFGTNSFSKISGITCSDTCNYNIPLPNGQTIIGLPVFYSELDDNFENCRCRDGICKEDECVDRGSIFLSDTCGGNLNEYSSINDVNKLKGQANSNTGIQEDCTMLITEGIDFKLTNPYTPKTTTCVNPKLIGNNFPTVYPSGHIYPNTDFIVPTYVYTCDNSVLLTCQDKNDHGFQSEAVLRMYDKVKGLMTPKQVIAKKSQSDAPKELWITNCVDTVQSCTSTCTLGKKQCNGNSLQTCADYNGDRCYEWGGDTNCQYGCSSNKCKTCTPKTCSQLKYKCGNWDNGCGTTINCGNCQSGQTCNSIGQCITGNLQYQCPSLGKQCGNWNDGCGNSVNCGTCSSGQNCNNGACI